MNRTRLIPLVGLTLLILGAAPVWAGTEVMILPGDAAAAKAAPAYEQGDLLFYGRIHTMPEGGGKGRWVIAGRTVKVLDETYFDDKGFAFEPGAEVRVICEQEKRRLTAKSITIRR